MRSRRPWLAYRAAPRPIRPWFDSPAARLIGTPRKRTISAREVSHGRSNEPGWSAGGEAEQARECGIAVLGRGGRMSRQRKSAAVLRLLRGEDLETVSRELGV